MLNKYAAAVVMVLFFMRSSHAGENVLDISGIDGNVLHFGSWDDRHGGWSDVQYKGRAGSFRIYGLPSKTSLFTGGEVASADAGMVSPDKKIVMVQRIVFGEVTNENGEEVNSEQAHCDAISLDDGCVQYSGWIEQCDGSWVDKQWKVSTGEVLNFSQKSMPPKWLLSETSHSSSNEARSNSLRDLMFMGVPSYMSCYPAEESISEYNDVAFYFAHGGEHILAMQIYDKLVSLAPNRVPLKLNIADSLWALGKEGEAKIYYRDYQRLMKDKGGDAKIPKRVKERLD